MAAFRFARETPNGYSALKSRSQRDTLVDRRTETECPKLIGPKISIDRTILMPTYQFALRSHCSRRDEASRIKDESAIARQNARLIGIEVLSGEVSNICDEQLSIARRMHEREIQIGLSGDIPRK